MSGLMDSRKGLGISVTWTGETMLCEDMALGFKSAACRKPCTCAVHPSYMTRNPEPEHPDGNPKE